MALRLWTLNEATGLFSGRSRWRYDVAGRSVEVRAGQRSHEVNVPDAQLGAPTARSQLMHEGTKTDEYWVPLVVKAFGDPAAFRANWVDLDDPVKTRLFDNIVDHYRAALHPHARWWDGLAHDPTIKMGTRGHMGLYDVLQRYSRDGEQNILVGYSEGGLMARYLAFIDEHISTRRCVAGVMTVHAPNAGSVFGAANNADRFVAALVSALFAAAGVDRDVVREFHTSLVEDAPTGMGTQILRWLGVAGEAGLRAASSRHQEVLRRVAPLVNLAGSSAQFEARLWNHSGPRGVRAKSALLYQVHRWLSGLRGDEQYAFTDMDVRSVDEPHSVLGSLYDNPLRETVHGAICGWDNEVENLLLPGVLEAVDNIFPVVDDRLKDVSRIAQEYLLFESEPPPLGHDADVFRDLMIGGIAGETAEQLKIFDGTCLRDGTGPWWTPGIVDERAHDCIIPAAYQVLPVPDGDLLNTKFIGNFVFADQNHATGTTRSRPTAHRLLELIVKQL